MINFRCQAAGPRLNFDFGLLIDFFVIESIPKACIDSYKYYLTRFEPFGIRLEQKNLLLLIEACRKESSILHTL